MTDKEYFLVLITYDYYDNKTWSLFNKSDDPLVDLLTFCLDHASWDHHHHVMEAQFMTVQCSQVICIIITW